MLQLTCLCLSNYSNCDLTCSYYCFGKLFIPVLNVREEGG